jgi:hypothetical protein
MPHQSDYAMCVNEPSRGAAAEGAANQKGSRREFRQLPSSALDLGNAALLPQQNRVKIKASAPRRNPWPSQERPRL